MQHKNDHAQIFGLNEEMCSLFSAAFKNIHRRPTVVEQMTVLQLLPENYGHKWSFLIHCQFCHIYVMDLPRELLSMSHFH